MSSSALLDAALLALISGLLAWIGLQLRHRSPDAFGKQVQQALDQLGKGVAHHVEVTQVLALAQHFEDDPGLLDRLRQYAPQVVAASLQARLDALGAQQLDLLDELGRMRREAAREATPGYYAGRVKRLETMGDHLTGQIAAAEGMIAAFLADHPGAGA